jgi:hypothetical protein
VAEGIYELIGLDSLLEHRVPVTAKLSRKFYEKLGDDIAAELVDWFNAVDATYKSDLKETNELNWERYKATLHAESSSLREEMTSLRGELRGEMASLRGELRGEMASLGGELREEMASLRGDLRAEMKAMQSNLMKWMFIYWSGTVATIIGLGYFGPK